MSSREHTILAGLLALLLFTVMGVQANNCSDSSNDKVSAQESTYEGKVYRVGNDPVTALIIALDSGEVYEMEAQNSETQQVIEDSQFKRVRVRGSVRDEPSIHGDAYIEIDQAEIIQ